MTTILRQAPATVLWDSACRLLGTAAVQPWAFLGHTHRLGRLVTGWRVAGAGGGDMAWAGLGSTDPTLPQSFRPVSKYKFNIIQNIKNILIVKLRQGSGKEGQGMALKAKGLKA